MSGPDYGHLRHPGPSFTVSFDAVASRSSGGVMKLDVHPSCLVLLRQCILHMHTRVHVQTCFPLEIVFRVSCGMRTHGMLRHTGSQV